MADHGMTANQLAARLDRRWLLIRTEEEGDCLRWKQGKSECGQPKYSFKIGGKQYSRQLRQIVWAMEGKPPLTGNQVMTVTCGNRDCLNHEHMKVTTRAAVIAKTARRPDVRRRVMVAATTYRRKTAKITIDQARYIRDSDRTLSTVAQELGISIAWASKVRRGEAWRELLASPFAGLGA